MFVCYICQAEMPMDFVNKHHKVPKSLGGSDSRDNLVELCSGCHQDMHVLARMMRNPKRVGEVRSSLQQMHPSGGAQSRCLELAKLVIESQLLEKEQVAADMSREIRIGLKLKRPYRDALQLLARDRGLSMADYTRKIMEGHIRSVYPSLEMK